MQGVVCTRAVPTLGLKVQFTPRQLDSIGNWKETLDDKQYITRAAKQQKFLIFLGN